MINVLVVEDDNIKYGRIHEVLLQSGIDSSRLKHVVTAADAYEALRSHKYDLMLLDINIPRRHGEGAHRGGGVELLAELRRPNRLHRPRYVVGVTAYEDLAAEFGQRFTDELWTLILFSENTDRWISQVGSKIDYIRAVKASENFSDGRTFGVDLAIVCALEGVEFSAVKCLPCDFQPLKLMHDESRYLTGNLVSDDRTFSVIAAAAPRMGMSASAILTSKIIAQFRPRYLAMVGICAGRFGKVSLGDVIIADPTWDWGSGKIESVDNVPNFRPSPHQIELDTDFRERLRELTTNVETLARVRAGACGNKPSTELRAHFGPSASGAAVVASKETFDALLDQHRNLLGIEMEAYGVALACKGSGRPRPTCLIMKSVCEFADKDKSDDYQEYAAHTSAMLLLEAARQFLKDPVTP